MQLQFHLVYSIFVQNLGPPAGVYQDSLNMKSYHLNRQDYLIIMLCT